jgi:hypothetical protein
MTFQGVHAADASDGVPLTAIRPTCGDGSMSWSCARLCAQEQRSKTVQPRSEESECERLVLVVGFSSRPHNRNSCIIFPSGYVYL